MISKHVLLFLCLLGLGYTQSLLSPLEFLADLTNTTVQGIDKMVKDFRFIETSEENIFFVLYLPKNKTQNITSEDALKFINPENPTKILIHGWTNSASYYWISKMASLYHQKGNYNVIAPDWSKDAAKNYLYAASVTQSVGDIIGRFILNITEKNPNFPAKVHILGHSLGGQVAGFTGKKVSTLGKKIDRITGLDVASPLFEVPLRRPPSLRINSTDATFVDLIHTNKGLNGVAQHYGHADFYVNNGGPIQSGCGNIDLRKALSCSHHRVHMIYSETILNEQKYEAVSCSNSLSYNLGLCKGQSKAFLGEGVTRSARGAYYVRT